MHQSGVTIGYGGGKVPKIGLIEVYDDTLAWIEVHEEDSRETIYDPSEGDIRQLCRTHDFPEEQVLNLVRDRERGVYGLLFIGPDYREGLV